ncbi:hypothetical protein B9Z55_000541 [Caenorhabditis nigoni]|uniref:F-box domain-containing protein n=1 Tax=Caenorhabditis nigoni TaxID=1611254 RepID=A0A2G5VTZ5_9PELO|nr:hypothetical protein B9Z55_000541 [Caenorhabditis nigoni]
MTWRIAGEHITVVRTLMSSDLKNLTEKTAKLSIDPIYETNWCDMPAEIKLECIGKMKFNERLSLRCTAKAERSLVDSQKVEIDEGRFGEDNEQSTFVLLIDNKRYFVKDSKYMNDAFELLNYIKKVGDFKTLYFSLGFAVLFAVYERFHTDDGLFTAKEIEFSNGIFNTVVAVLRKIKNGVESIKLRYGGLDSDQLAGILAIPHVQNVSYWHIHDYEGTDSLHKVAQMWIDKNAKLGSTFQVSNYDDGSFAEFLEHLDDRILSKNEQRVRIRTNNADCHILLERGLNEISEIVDFPQYFRLKVISAEMKESEYDNDCKEWICIMDPEVSSDSDNSSEQSDDVHEYDD